MFFAYPRPAEAAHWCRQALIGCFQGQLICAEATWPKESRKKRPSTLFLGLKHLAHCPKSRCKPPSAPLLAPPSLQVATMGTHGPVAAHPPPAQRAAESRARLCCILGRSGACAVAVRTREQRPAEAVQNRFGRKGIGKRTENRPPPTPAPCPKETNRTGGNREGDLHFAHAAIKKCLRSAHRKQQKCTFSHGQNPHLRSIDSSFRWRVAATLQNGAQRRTGRRHILIERAHVNFCRAARRGADCR